MDPTPLLKTGIVGDRLVLSAGGSWTAGHARELELLVDGLSGEARNASTLSLDMHAVDALDTFGAWLAERVIRDWQVRGREAQMLGLAEHHRGLLQAVQRTNRKVQERAAKESWLLSALERIGRGVVELGRDLVPFLDMLGALAAAVGRTLANPRSLRITSLVHHLDRVGWQAVSIILLITFLIGGIIAQQGIFHFRSRADVYVVDMVGILVLREIGVLIVAIMVAGRSGSSYTAELGSMKMREEIDALAHHGP